MKKLVDYFSHRPHFSLITAIVWTVLIFIGCSLPSKDIPKLGLFDHFDKLVHFAFFFIFFITWRLYFYKKKSINILLLIISLLFGFSLEFYQLHFVAGRSFDVWDAVADTFGALVACLLFYKYVKVE